MITGNAPIFAELEAAMQEQFTNLVDARALGPEAVPAMANDVREHAADNKGGLPLGFQSGAAAMPVFVVDRVPPELASWARGPQKIQWAVGLFPIVVAVDGSHVSYRIQPQKWGRMYEKHLQGIAAGLVGPVT